MTITKETTITLLSHAHNCACAHTYSSLHTRIHITYYTPYHTHYTIFIPYTYTDNFWHAWWDDPPLSGSLSLPLLSLSNTNLSLCISVLCVCLSLPTLIVSFDYGMETLDPRRSRRKMEEVLLSNATLQRWLPKRKLKACILLVHIFSNHRSSSIFFEITIPLAVFCILILLGPVLTFHSVFSSGSSTVY